MVSTHIYNLLFSSCSQLTKTQDAPPPPPPFQRAPYMANAAYNKVMYPNSMYAGYASANSPVATYPSATSYMVLAPQQQAQTGQYYIQKQHPSQAYLNMYWKYSEMLKV